MHPLLKPYNICSRQCRNRSIFAPLPRAVPVEAWKGSFPLVGADVKLCCRTTKPTLTADTTLLPFFLIIVHENNNCTGEWGCCWLQADLQPCKTCQQLICPGTFFQGSSFTFRSAVQNGSTRWGKQRDKTGHKPEACQPSCAQCCTKLPSLLKLSHSEEFKYAIRKCEPERMLFQQGHVTVKGLKTSRGGGQLHLDCPVSSWKQRLHSVMRDPPTNGVPHHYCTTNCTSFQKVSVKAQMFPLATCQLYNDCFIDNSIV